MESRPLSHGAFRRVKPRSRMSFIMVSPTREAAL